MLKYFTPFLLITLFSSMMALEPQTSQIIEEEDEFLACVESDELYTNENERELIEKIEKMLIEEQIRFASASYLQYKHPTECTPAISNYLKAMQSALYKAHLEYAHAHRMIAEVFPETLSFEEAVFNSTCLLKVNAITADTLRKIENKYLDAQAQELINRYYEVGKRACISTIYNLSLVARITN